MGQVKVKTKATVVEESEASLKTSLTRAIQTHMDNTCVALGYDSILSLCTYATSTIEHYAKEGQAGIKWRDDVWELSRTIFSDVLAGNRTAPTRTQVVLELPELIWPT